MCEEQLMAKAKSPGKRPQAGSKPQAVAAGATVVVDPIEPKKPRTSPAQFFSQEIGRAHV